MSKKKKIIIGWVVALVVILGVLYYFGIFKVNLTQRFVYAGCDSGCTTNVNDVSDCTGFLAYLKSTDKEFVSGANAAGINLDKPDKITKSVSASGKISCQYWAN